MTRTTRQTFDDDDVCTYSRTLHDPVIVCRLATGFQASAVHYSEEETDDRATPIIDISAELS